MVNSRESLAKIPSMNNDANPYIITLDIYKEGYWAYDISNYYKGRVDDNGTPFMVRWFEHGQLKNVQGLRPFIRGTVGQHTVDDQTDPDNPKVVPSPDCSQIDQTGETTDTAPGGIAIYRMVNQCFTQEGMFYGEIGLKDSSGLVLSSVDIAFKVLGGRMNMIGARKFYVSEFEKALADLKERLEQHDKDYDQKLAGKISEFDNKTNKVIDDARNTYMAETKDAHDSLDALKSEIRANRAEQENLTNHLAGTEQQIEIHDIPTRPEFEAQNARIDEKLDSMNLNIESYKDLDAVKAKYPNGSSNLIVTNDGYRAVWDGTEWVKGSAFVAAELKDKAVVPTKVSNVAIDQIADDAIDWNNLKKWPIDTAPITLTPNNDGTFNLANQVVKDDKDHGFIFKVSASSLHDTFYFNIYHEPLAANNTNSVEIYLFNANGNLANKIISETNSDKNYSSYAFQKKFFGAYLIDDTFSFLLVLHDSDQIKMRLSVSNIPGFHQLSNIEKKVEIPDLIKTPITLNSNFWKLWNEGSEKNTLKNNAAGLFFAQNNSGDEGFYLPVRFDSSQDLYVTLTYQTNSHFSVLFIPDLSHIGAVDTGLTDENGDLQSEDQYKTVVFKISKDKLKMMGINDQALLLIATHEKNAFVEIKDLDVSNSQGSRFLTQKIKSISDNINIDYGNTVGSIDLLTATQSVPDKVHFACSNFICDKDSQTITKISVITNQTGQLHFKVGTIDQNSILVNASDYYLQARVAGINSFDVNIPINSKQRLFLDLSNGIVDLYNQSDLKEQILLQDENHVLNNSDYSGMTFYLFDGSLPLEFTYRNQKNSERIDQNNEEIQALKQKMNGVSKQLIQKQKLILSDDKLTYQLKIDDGKLVLKKLTPDKVVFLGNSLTCSAGNIGCDASDSNHDYYHYISEYMKSKNPSVQINPRTNIASWEQDETTSSREDTFNKEIKPLLSADTNLVMLQLGDNVNTDARKQSLENDSEELIKNIKLTCPQAQIYWIYGWFGDEQVFNSIEQACQNEQITSININDLNTKENQGTVGSTFLGLDGKTYTTNSGQAAHPGDKGHKAIADRIISNFDF